MADDARLADRSALITGASSGVGRATAEAFANAGVSVSLAARREDRLTALADTLTTDTGVETCVKPTNVTEIDQVERMVESTVDALGTLDIVVVNAGIGPELEKDVDELPLEQYRRMMAVNTDGVYYTVRTVLPHLRDSGGHLVFVGSFTGQYPYSLSPTYAATKWWTRGFGLSLAANADRFGIEVTIVNPSGIRTEFGKEYRDTTNEERLAAGDAFEPEDIAEAIVFSTSPKTPNTVNELNMSNTEQFSQF